MLKPQLIIHIGPHKTGTTSLQNFLRENSKGLYNQGYFYPDDTKFHHYLAKGFITGKPDIEKISTIAKRAKNRKIEKVVLSSEAFFRFMNRHELLDHFSNIVLENFREVKVIAFVRSQYERTESALTQIIKTKPFESEIATYPSTVTLNYLNLASFWDKYFGEGCFTPLIYERTKKIDVISSFCNELAIDTRNFSNPKVKNTKPELDKFRLIFYFNQLITKKDLKTKKRSQRIITQFSEGLINDEASWDGTTKYKIIPFNEAKAMEERFSAANENFRKKYFPNRKVLFDEIKPYNHDDLDISNISKSNLDKAFKYLLKFKGVNF